MKSLFVGALYLLLWFDSRLPQHPHKCHGTFFMSAEAGLGTSEQPGRTTTLCSAPSTLLGGPLAAPHAAVSGPRLGPLRGSGGLGPLHCTLWGSLGGPHFLSCLVLVWGIVATLDPRQCIMEPQPCFPWGAGRCSWVPAVSPSCPGYVALALCGATCLQARGLTYLACHGFGRKSEEQRQENDCPEGRSLYDVHSPLSQGGGRAGRACGEAARKVSRHRGRGHFGTQPGQTICQKGGSKARSRRRTNVGSNRFFCCGHITV